MKLVTSLAERSKNSERHHPELEQTAKEFFSERKAKWIHIPSFLFRKTANGRTTQCIHFWLSHPRPVRPGFHCRERLTIIQEENAAYSVSTFSLTMEMEAVTHALRWVVSRDGSHTKRSCHHPHRLHEPAINRVKWEAQAGVRESCTSRIEISRFKTLFRQLLSKNSC